MLVKLQGSLDGSPGSICINGQRLRTGHREIAQLVLGFSGCQVRHIAMSGAQRLKAVLPNKRKFGVAATLRF